MNGLRFDCVFYYVRDLERSIEFYERVLGFHVTSREVVARFEVDGVLFELVPSADERFFSGQGNARLTLAVDDLRTARDELRRSGVLTSEVQVVSNGRFVTLNDPDGNEILLWQYA